MRVWQAMGEEPRHTGLFSICCLLFRPFLMWLFNALESRGFKSSKLHNNSEETDMTAPQLSNSPQYCKDVSTHTQGQIKSKKM